MRRFARSALLFIGLCLASAPRAAFALPPDQIEGWRSDLAFLANSIREIHPAPFNVTSRTDFDAAVTRLNADLSNLDGDRAVLEFSRLVASVGDGHTMLQLFHVFHGAAAIAPFQSSPIRLERFSDGWFVRAATTAYSAILGGRVESLAGMPPDAVFKAVSPYVSRDNEMTVLDRAPELMESAEALHALGVTPDANSFPIVVSRDGKRVTAAVRPLVTTAYPIFVDMRDSQAPVPLWARRSDEPYWFDFDEPSRTLYVAYNAVLSRADHPLSAFWPEVMQFAQTHPIARCVIDLRRNGGGDGFLNKPMILALVRSPVCDRQGTLFALIGRATFSAAQMAVSDLEKWTDVTFVGEPGGAAPNTFGDPRVVVLPYSKIAVGISTVFWQTTNAFDRRRMVKPAVAAPFSSSDYRNGVDPALVALNGWKPLAELLEPALRQGDEAALTATVDRFVADPRNMYAAELQINMTGYSLLRSGKPAMALALFRANVRLFPESWNAHDSLAEALAGSHDRPAALAEYERALALAPPDQVARLRTTILGLKGSVKQ